MEISKQDLEALSEARRQEARALYRAKHYAGAYYLAGYAVELAIKACIAKNFRANALPDRSFTQRVYTHNLEDLIGLAGLRSDFERARSGDSNLSAAWNAVRDWNEQSRYLIWDAVSAAGLIKGVGDSKSGVLQWLRQHY